MTRALDEKMAPAHPAAKVALAPVAMPVGFTALAVDGFFVNPVLAAPKACDDASSVFTEISSTGPLEIFVFPMRVVTFPCIFIGSEMMRCTLPGFPWG